MILLSPFFWYSYVNILMFRCYRTLLFIVVYLPLMVCYIVYLIKRGLINMCEEESSGGEMNKTLDGS